MDDILLKNNVILKKSKSVNLNQMFKTRSYECILGVDINSKNVVVFYRNAKSRFITKDALKLEEMGDKVIKESDRVVKEKLFFYNSEICSKALNLLKKSGWKCFFVM